jgi:hypothetical protein
MRMLWSFQNSMSFQIARLAINQFSGFIEVGQPNHNIFTADASDGRPQGL